MALLLAIAAYGINTSFAAELVTLLQYVVGVQSSMRIWEPGKSPLPAKRQGNMGRPPWLFTNGAQTINLFSVKQLGQQKRRKAMREWKRDGRQGRLYLAQAEDHHVRGLGV